jgi:hypothetical protein
MTFAEPSIKSLFLEMRVDGQVLASGSGFLVQNERHVFLVTNRHNVTGCPYKPLNLALVKDCCLRTQRALQARVMR